MPKLSALVIIGLLISLAAEVRAQDVVVPNGQLPLRASPPGTFFQGKGDQIGTVSPREPYRVLERKSVPTVAGAEQWIRVQGMNDPKTEGWIYAGKDDRRTVSPR
jgi:hypothetical protein